MYMNPMLLGNKFYTWTYEERFFLLGLPVEVSVVVNIVPVVVVVDAPINVSHCWPVCVCGHVQYGVFPFIWHVPPDWQKPFKQLA